jgi:hypothetical protein
MSVSLKDFRKPSLNLLLHLVAREEKPPSSLPSGSYPARSQDNDDSRKQVKIHRGINYYFNTTHVETHVK